jgi:hypothetical protein
MGEPPLAVQPASSNGSQARQAPATHWGVAPPQSPSTRQAAHWPVPSTHSPDAPAHGWFAPHRQVRLEQTFVVSCTQATLQAVHDSPRPAPVFTQALLQHS